MQDNVEVFRIIELVGGISAFGLLAWLVRRTFTHTIPRLAADFKEAMDRLLSFARDELKATREEFRQEQREQRADFQNALKNLRDDFKSEIQYLGQRIDRLSDAVRDAKPPKRGE